MRIKVFIGCFFIKSQRCSQSVKPDSCCVGKKDELFAGILEKLTNSQKNYSLIREQDRTKITFNLSKRQEKYTQPAYRVVGGKLLKKMGYWKEVAIRMQESEN